jgi:hypothetical protein
LGGRLFGGRYRLILLRRWADVGRWRLLRHGRWRRRNRRAVRLNRRAVRLIRPGRWLSGRWPALPERLAIRARRRRGTHPVRWRIPRWQGHRCAELEDQSGPVIRIAESDGPTITDEDGGHPDAVDIHSAFAPVDGQPALPVVMQHQVSGRAGNVGAVEPDIRPAVMADGHVSTRGKGVPLRSEPDNQGGSKRLRRHGHHLPHPSSWA